MNPIERLEAVAEKLALNWLFAPEKELLSIIEALKQQDEAVRKVAEELYDCRFTYDHPFDEWAARLRAALEGKHE